MQWESRFLALFCMNKAEMCIYCQSKYTKEARRGSPFWGQIKRWRRKCYSEKSADMKHLIKTFGDPNCKQTRKIHNNEHTQIPQISADIGRETRAPPPARPAPAPAPFLRRGPRFYPFPVLHYLPLLPSLSLSPFIPYLLSLFSLSSPISPISLCPPLSLVFTVFPLSF